MLLHTKRTRELGVAIYVASIVLLVADGFTAAQTIELPQQSPVASSVSDQIVAESPERSEQAKENEPLNLKAVDGKTYSMLVGASQRFECEFRIPELVTDDPAVTTVTPLSPTEVQVTASAAGRTSVTFKGEHDEEVTIEIEVTPDVGELSRALKRHFPNSKIDVKALAPQLVLLKGRTTSDQMANVLEVAKDYFPHVTNQLKIEGELSHVAMQIRSYEVDSKKLRALKVSKTLSGEEKNVSRIVELLTEPDSEDELVRAKGSFVKVFRDTKPLLAMLEKSGAKHRGRVEGKANVGC